VPLEGRGSLPFALVHGESLVAAASWAVGEAGIQLVDASVPFSTVREADRPLLLHDPLCPLTPADFLAAAVDECVRTGRTVVGYRPVTDTIKQQTGEVLGATIDRSGLRAVASPVVIPGSVLARLEQLDASDFAALVATLSQYGEICWLEAPALARRISSAAELVVLEALSRSLA
jgi:2-C-methyl-D-erythritol 4-phosphate cytidylyltransferase